MDEMDQALWRALQPLRSVACWLMTGAHPDDEWNGFLAWLRWGRGVRTVYACATRGEGGQNALGPERGRLLGALRSREMDLAARAIGLAVRWIGAGPANGFDDPVFDFGFSKSGEDTLRRWGADRLRDRIVRLIRAERPDALSPTFLDVPGQHGHHRAVTRTTLEAAELAADAAYLPELPAWQVAKIYLPAFSGGGGSYDDELPPPPATVRVDLGERFQDASWAQWGERSRRHHASQGMGRELPDGPRPFALHLLAGQADAALPMDGVPHRLSELADTLPAGPLARQLADAGAAIEDAIAAFPDRPRVAAALHRALLVLAHLPPCLDAIMIRVERKRRELAVAAALALGIGADIAVAQLRAGQPATVSIAVRGPAAAAPRLPPGWAAAIPRDAAPFGSVRDGFDPFGGTEPIGATVSWTYQGSAARLEADPPVPVTLAPASEASVSPRALVRRGESGKPAVLTLIGAEPPASWPIAARSPAGLEIAPHPGLLDLPPAGARLARLGDVAVVEPATASILRTSIAIDAPARIGIVAGEADETLGWLRQLDIAAIPVDPARLGEGVLSGLDVLVVGVFAFGQVPALRAHREAIMAWTDAGGSLVTLYHRPGDGWDGGRTPPLPLRIGSPSIRWRVTDPAAPVRVLAAEHRLLTWPNRIAAADWDGWVRERGLYFAAEWDPAYVPLLSLSDPGEVPLQGALLAAPVGRGRHVHVALALHHQFSALVPGAFRLLANLVARPGA